MSSVECDAQLNKLHRSEMNSSTANELTAEEAERLLKIEKREEGQSRKYIFPGDEGGLVEVPLISSDEKERFLFHIKRRKIILTCTYQTRTKGGIVLARLDFDAPHRNPDGSRVGVPHLHTYREGWGDKWATDRIPFLHDGDDISNSEEIVNKFLDFCHINRLTIEYDLFSNS